jgi:predicted Zn finger-like uncharacterized protein
MEVSCPNCYTRYPIHPEKIPERGATPTCKKCGVAFTIVKATGDPVKDRTQRMKGYVLIRENTTEEFSRETGTLSKEPNQKILSARKILENKHFRVGAALAGILLLLCSSAFFVWKTKVHSSFEKALKGTFARVSNDGFAIAFDSVRFSVLGGLSREKGCIQGLTIANRQRGVTLKGPDKIYFELEPSQKHFVTKPFDVHVDGKGNRSALKGCVLELQERNGQHVRFTADEAFSILNGIEIFTIRGVEIAFSFQGTEWKENPRLQQGNGEFGVRVKNIEVWSEAVARNVDIMVSVKNGLFAKDQQAGDAIPVNYMNMLRAQWGENKAVAILERCALDVLGSTVKANGRVEFQNPAERSEASLRVSAKDFSHIMKYIHRLNESAFDWIVLALVTLDEKKTAVYDQNSDLLEMTLSYKNSKIKINDCDLQSLI